MITQFQIKKIHTYKHILNMSDKEYKAFLKSFNVDSSVKLTKTQARMLIRVFESFIADKNNVYKKKYDDFAGRAEFMATPSQLRKIEVVWKEISPNDTPKDLKKTLRLYLEKRFAVSDTKFLTKARAGMIIGALENFKNNKLFKQGLNRG